MGYSTPNPGHRAEFEANNAEHEAWLDGLAVRFGLESRDDLPEELQYSFPPGGRFDEQHKPTRRAERCFSCGCVWSRGVGYREWKQIQKAREEKERLAAARMVMQRRRRERGTHARRFGGRPERLPLIDDYEET